MGFATALSGLKAASTSLQVTGNNIANSQTTGFKESRAEFADVYASSIGGVSKTQPGAGVRVTEVAQQFNQGNIESTQNSLDLAVSGNGFFVLADKVNLPDPNKPNAAVDPSVPTAYTRDGAFKLDSKGNVVNSQGKYLLAFAANDPASVDAGFSVGVFRPLTIDTAQGLPKTTTSIGMKLNINGAANVPSNPVFSPTDPKSYNNTTSVTTYDTQGNAHIASTYYVKSPVSNAWNAYLFLDGFGITTGGPLVPPATVAPNSKVAASLNAPGTPIPMTFDSAGKLLDVGLRAAATISGTTVTAGTTTVNDNATAAAAAALVGNVYTTSTATVTAAGTAVTNTATTVTKANIAVGSGGVVAADNTAVQTAANNAVTSTGNLVTAANNAVAANVAPVNTNLSLATAAQTTANKAAASALLAQTAANTLVGTPSLANANAAAAAAATASADAIAAQTAANTYDLAAGSGAASVAFALAQKASVSAAAFAADAAAVNTASPTSAAIDAAWALAKSTAATAATSAASYATAAAAVNSAATANAITTLPTALTSPAGKAAADAATAKAAAVAYDALIAGSAVGASQATKVDFGPISLAAINPNIKVDAMAFSIDFFSSTQFATPFSVNGLNQNGLPAGNLTGVDVDGTGVVFARYSNGGSKALGQVALARFQSNQALAKLGDTTWAQTSNSGQPIYGAAGDNNFGAVQSSALEGSNVDLSAQLVKLIVAQQAYQANSQSITTEKTLIETILRA